MLKLLFSRVLSGNSTHAASPPPQSCLGTPNRWKQRRTVPEFTGNVLSLNILKLKPVAHFKDSTVSVLIHCFIVRLIKKKKMSIIVCQSPSWHLKSLFCTSIRVFFFFFFSLFVFVSSVTWGGWMRLLSHIAQPLSLRFTARLESESPVNPTCLSGRQYRPETCTDRSAWSVNR